MKLNKILIYFIIGIFLTIFVSSSPSQINILNLEYNLGHIELIEKTSKVGYYPDRLDQPIFGHNLSIYSVDESNLYSFKFVPPFVEFTDGFDKDKNIGKILISDNFNFSLIIPSYINENKIIIYDENQKEVGVFNLVEKQSKTTSNLILILIIGSIVFLILLFIRNYRNSKN